MKRIGDRSQKPTHGELARFWEDMDRDVKVFIVEEDKRKEVDVEKRLEGGREWFWFEEKVPSRLRSNKELMSSRPRT